MNGIKHPFTRALYEQDGNGNVLVTMPSGASGLFKSDGQWISGDLREADPQMCGWIAGPIMGNHRLVESHRT